MTKVEYDDLRHYQQEAVDDMFKDLEKLITRGQKRYLLEAPTGSGKTIIMSNFLKKWVDETQQKLSFIWLAPRKLHTQSKEKIEEHLADTQIICSHFDQLNDNIIKENEIYFENWESLHQLNNNLIIRENESGKFLEEIVQGTKDDGRKVVAIIDESHRQTRGPQTTQVLNIINPDLTIEVTATPPAGVNYDKRTTVDREDVVDEGMIKKQILINPKWLDRDQRSSLSNKAVIKQGLEKRKELVDKYKKEKIPENVQVNPLLTIQIPQRGQNLTDLQEKVENILNGEGITYENGKLAVYLSDDKKNLDDTNGLEDGKRIEDNDNEVQVLIFKEAIAVGWDCPRAHILSLFREHTNLTFGLQTIGRIMRMPDLQHYSDEELNSAYIYTNLPPFDLEQQFISGYVSEDISARNDSIYKDIKLKSIHIKRVREITRLSRKFTTIFKKNKEIQKLMKTVDKNSLDVTSQVISDGVITNYDQAGEITAGTAYVLTDDDEIEELFDRNLIKWCGTKEKSRSHGVIRTALYRSMKEIHGVDWMKENEKVQRILLSNLPIISGCVDIALEKYDVEVVQKKAEPEVVTTDPYEIPPSIEHYGDREKLTQDTDKSIMQPLFTDSIDSGIESKFMKFLNDSGNVLWWYKNKVNEPKYFAILWEDSSNNKKQFYADWIIQFDDGIGLFDTKSGNTVSDPETKLKAKALAKYIKIENPNRSKNKLRGGIVTNTNRDYSGRWKYNKDAKKPFDSANVAKWDTLYL